MLPCVSVTLIVWSDTYADADDDDDAIAICKDARSRKTRDAGPKLQPIRARVVPGA